MTRSTTLATMEEALGPGDTRYFGRGFQRVTHHLTEVTVQCDRITGTVSAIAIVDYPADWSMRTTASAGPHVSTVDAVVIAAQLAEAYLTYGHRLDAAARARMWVRAFDMKAGATAQTELSGIAVHGRRSGMRLGPWGTSTVISTFDFRIGTVRLSCQVQHEVGTPVMAPGAWPDVEQLLGSPADRHYGRGFTQRRHDIRQVVVDATGQRAHASVRVEDSAPASLQGLAASYEPALSLVDATVCTAQLAQVLAYHLEEVDRGETDTLWMRRFGMRCEKPAVPITDVIAMAGRVVRRTRVDRMGKSWRIFRMDGDIGGVEAVASLAFNVPGAVSVVEGARRDGGR